MERGEAKERLESRHRRATPVEAENVFVDVVLHVARADAVMGASEPGL